VSVWDGHKGLRRFLRVVSVLIVAGAVIAPSVALIFSGLDHAAAVAQLVSIPVGILGLSGTLFTSQRLSGGTPGNASSNYSARRSTRAPWWHLNPELFALVVIGVMFLVALVAILIVAAFASR
jgi:hypothetical protein